MSQVSTPRSSRDAWSETRSPIRRGNSSASSSRSAAVVPVSAGEVPTLPTLISGQVFTGGVGRNGATSDEPSSRYDGTGSINNGTGVGSRSSSRGSARKVASGILQILTSKDRVSTNKITPREPSPDSPNAVTRFDSGALFDNETYDPATHLTSPPNVSYHGMDKQRFMEEESVPGSLPGTISSPQAPVFSPAHASRVSPLHGLGSTQDQVTKENSKNRGSLNPDGSMKSPVSIHSGSPYRGYAPGQELHSRAPSGNYVRDPNRTADPGCPVNAGQPVIPDLQRDASMLSGNTITSLPKLDFLNSPGNSGPNLGDTEGAEASFTALIDYAASSNPPGYVSLETPSKLAGLPATLNGQYARLPGHQTPSRPPRTPLAPLPVTNIMPRPACLTEGCGRMRCIQDGHCCRMCLASQGRNHDSWCARENIFYQEVD